MKADGSGGGLPLEGVLVVAIEQAVAAPLATRHLADQGARVIKVERPNGDFAREYDDFVSGFSCYFAWLNRNKESIVCDLKEPDDRGLVEALLARADVFVQNLAPGAASRLELAGEQVRTRYPEIIACDISGYGSTGPYADKKAYDLLIQCETGLVSITGTPATPAKSGISVADISAGMYAFSGILSALYERERSGRGSLVEVSLFEALAEWMMQPWYATYYGDGAPPRAGAEHATIVPYGPVIAADGQQITIAIQNQREWKEFCSSVLGRPSLATDDRFATNSTRVHHRSELWKEIETAVSVISGSELIDRLETARIGYAVMRETDELRHHPQLVARDRWRPVDTPNGPIEALAPPMTIERRETRMGSVPALDEHGDAIRSWIQQSE